MKSFVEYFLNNAGEASEAVGYVALPDAVYDRAESNIKAGKTGTQFLNAEGKHKDGAVADIYQ